jgi:uncharacterized membrane protein
MALLPSGFALPPTPYLVAVLVFAGLAGTALWSARPQVTQAAVVAFAPWMVTGGVLYALYQVEVLPSVVAPLFGSPMVYLSTFALAGLVWALGARYQFMAPILLGSVGVVTMGGTLVLALGLGATRGTLSLTWPAVAVVVAALLTGALWAVARRLSVSVGDTGIAGLLVLFAHALDGVSTAVGHDVLQFGEQTPLSAIVLDIGAALPTAEVIGAGWLFVLVKVALALVVVHLLGDLVREDPRSGYATLGLVAAVGLGPGAHNVVLFAVVG